MAWPTDDLTNNSTDEASDVPASARDEIDRCILRLKDVIANAVEAATAATVVLRDAQGDINVHDLLCTGDISARAGSISDGVLEASTWQGSINSIRGCRATNTTSQNINDGADNTITMNTDTFDDLNMHSTSVNTDRVTVTDGVMRVKIKGLVRIPIFATGSVTVRLIKNGATVIDGGYIELLPATINQYVDLTSFSEDVVLSDYFTLSVENNTGSTITVGSGGGGNVLEVEVTKYGNYL